MAVDNICKLPRDMFYIIHEFLGIELNKLIVCSSELFRLIGSEFYYWHLNKEVSHNLFAEMRLGIHIDKEKFYRRILNPRKQLHMQLSSLYNITNGDILKEVHSLDLSGCPNLYDVSSLGNAYYLNLSNCRRLSDVSSLGAIHTLILSGCNGVSDVSMLGTVHSLDLSHCQNVIDVSALGNVHTLNLRSCHGVQDVSALGGVHSLDLTRCSGIRDVSALAGVYILNLSNCSSVSDVSALGLGSNGRICHSLDLSFVRDITSVTTLGTIHTLILRHCGLISDVSALRTVHTLFIDNCPLIHDVSMLGTVHTLHLIKCCNIVDVSGLGSVFSLHLRECTGIVDVCCLVTPTAAVTAETTPTIACDITVSDLNSNNNTASDLITDGAVSGGITGCCRNSVVGAGRLDTLEIFGCPNIVDISALVDGHIIPHLYVVGCDGLDNFDWALEFNDVEAESDHEIGINGNSGPQDVISVGGGHTLTSHFRRIRLWLDSCLNALFRPPPRSASV